MGKDRRKSLLLNRTRYTPRPAEISQWRAERLFNAWASGFPIDILATAHRLTGEQVRHIIRMYVRSLWRALAKWRLAEVRCHALAMELRLLRLGESAEPDRPIDTLAPPACWRKAYLEAGIETVYQLRAVDSEMLLANYRFPKGAVDWAIMKLDKMGLSHRLERAPGRKPIPKLGRVER